jgi:cysteinyl-tRNA synthetase
MPNLTNVLEAAALALADQLKAAEVEELAAKARYNEARRVAGHYRQQLHFARMRLTRATMHEDKADGLAKRMKDPTLTQEEREASQEAFYRELDKALTDD